MKGPKLDKYLEERELVKKTIKELTTFLGGPADIDAMRKVFKGLSPRLLSTFRANCLILVHSRHRH